jgi:hypothetical protein
MFTLIVEDGAEDTVREDVKLLLVTAAEAILGEQGDNVVVFPAAFYKGGYNVDALIEGKFRFEAWTYNLSTRHKDEGHRVFEVEYRIDFGKYVSVRETGRPQCRRDKKAKQPAILPTEGQRKTG